MPVQLRFHSGHTSGQYVAQEGWRSASLPYCPAHLRTDCGIAKHGTYRRVDPPGTLIARWYCPPAHRTFSLLPDHLAARFPGTLRDIEAVVAAVEQAPSLEAAAEVLRPDDVSLPSALRWIRRRVQLVHTALAVIVSLLPELCLGCAPTIEAFRVRLGCETVLVCLRAVGAAHLAGLPRPLGFRAPGTSSGGRKRGFQQRSGTDPPQNSR